MQQFIYDLIVLFAPAFLIGILHTLIPCEDKAIFFFWSSGISKTPGRSLLILIFYGLGLILSNLIITIIAIAISLTPQFLIPDFSTDPYLLSFIGALASTIAAIILFILITRSDYAQKIHSKYKDEIVKLNWEKDKTPFLFGVLVGFAPCFIEIFIYYKCVTLVLTYDFIMALIYVLYFSVGTFIGLLFIALAKHGTAQKIKPEEEKRNLIFILMILIIIVFNIVIMFVSIFRGNVYPDI